MTRPRVSIIMASYNHADYIGAAIESVLAQDFQEWELLIVDDASTDHTSRVLKPFKSDPRIRFFSFKFNRQYHVRSFASRHARGDYIALLNSDDLFYPGKLRKQIAYLDATPDCGATFTHAHVIDRSGNILKKSRSFAQGNRSRHQWLNWFFSNSSYLCISSAMIRRDLYDQVGGFNPLFIQIADRDLWIKICMQKEIHILQEKLTGMRDLGNNLSARTPASLSRSFLETLEMLIHYFTPEAIQQAHLIFPDIMKDLPEDSPAWRTYLLCQFAVSMPSQAIRQVGFSEWRKLLQDEETRQCLEKYNPRLLRKYLLCEGCIGLDLAAPQLKWGLFANASSREPHTSCWTGSATLNTICFSFKNPQISTALQLGVSAWNPPSQVRVQLYNQQTGERIITTILSRRKKFVFPEIDFTGHACTWVDLEVSMIPPKPGSLRHKSDKFKAKWSRSLRKRLDSATYP